MTRLARVQTAGRPLLLHGRRGGQFRRRAQLPWLVSGAVALCLAVVAGCSPGASDAAGDSAPVHDSSSFPSAPPTSPSASPTAAATRVSTVPDEPFIWAALGDSYSAGVGSLVAAEPGSCRREPTAAWGTAAARWFGVMHGTPTRVRFVACLGARMDDVVREQLPFAFQADVVTLSIGGNDAGFSKIIQDCLDRTCHSYDQPEDDLPNVMAVEGRTDWRELEHRLQLLYRSIAARMRPGGQLLIMAYPMPFARAARGACTAGISISDQGDVLLVNALAARLETAIQTAASIARLALQIEKSRVEIKVLPWTASDQPLPRRTVQVRGIARLVAFEPEGLCAPGASPLINRFRSDVTDSFHPTQHGYDVATWKILREAVRHERLRQFLAILPASPDKVSLAERLSQAQANG